MTGTGTLFNYEKQVSAFKIQTENRAEGRAGPGRAAACNSGALSAVRTAAKTRKWGKWEMPINSLCAGLGEPVYRLWVPTGEPRLPCLFPSGRIIVVKDAQASWLFPGFGYLRNRKKCSRARRGGEVRCLLGVGMAAGGVGGRDERGDLPFLLPYHPQSFAV